MNREILFKAWNPIVQRHAAEMSINDMLDYSGSHLQLCLVWRQYIGIKDKNGNRIFSGDVLQFREREDLDFSDVVNVYNMSVVWENDGWYYDGKDTAGKPEEFDLVEVEIIGNIHENPELVK